ncbi:MAG: hypothetical protein LBJ67_09565 [Planctomycetaceae bacterium]|nr:hypothetical protein [Planctomycetaceae bacterium]
MREVCDAYFAASENETHGIHTVIVNEKTGIQAREREYNSYEVPQFLLI